MMSYVPGLPLAKCRSQTLCDIRDHLRLHRFDSLQSLDFHWKLRPQQQCSEASVQPAMALAQLCLLYLACPCHRVLLSISGVQLMSLFLLMTLSQEAAICTCVYDILWRVLHCAALYDSIKVCAGSLGCITPHSVHISLRFWVVLRRIQSLQSAGVLSLLSSICLQELKSGA